MKKDKVIMARKEKKKKKKKKTFSAVPEKNHQEEDYSKIGTLRAGHQYDLVFKGIKTSS